MSQAKKVEQENTLPAAVTPDQMLAMAVEQGADLDKLEKLMGLQERWEAGQAKKAFDTALASFQAKLDPIVKKRQGHNSKYSDIDDIAQAIRPLLDEFKLSYRFKQSQSDKSITVRCVVTHSMGHSEYDELTADADTSGGKNAIQAMASTVTYLRRYSLTGALGITTGNDDNDGGRPEITVDDLLNYNNLVRDEFFSIAGIKKALLEKDFSTAKEALNELDHETQQALWKAPTKGGIFTTVERGQMRSEEFRHA